MKLKKLVLLLALAAFASAPATLRANDSADGNADKTTGSTLSDRSVTRLLAGFDTATAFKRDSLVTNARLAHPGNDSFSRNFRLTRRVDWSDRTYRPAEHNRVTSSLLLGFKWKF